MGHHQRKGWKTKQQEQPKKKTKKKEADFIRQSSWCKSSFEIRHFSSLPWDCLEGSSAEDSSALFVQDDASHPAF